VSPKSNNTVVTRDILKRLLWCVYGLPEHPEQKCLSRHRWSWYHHNCGAKNMIETALVWNSE
jgi:hypothetical protein